MITPAQLRTENLTNPLGIDRSCPQVQWLPTNARRQTAWQVMAHSGDHLLFNSGKTAGDETICRLPLPFTSRTRIDWQVQLWDENDIPGPAASAWFEWGLAHADWQAKWINPELPHPDDQRQPASYLRKRFSVSGPGAARLYITSHGLYDVFLNGSHLDGWLLAPGSSQYDRRLQVQTYDVTAMMSPGNNELIITLGDGWYRGCVHNTLDTNTFGRDLALLCQLEVNGYPILVSDESWQASQRGPLGCNDMMMGEEYDSRRWPIGEDDWHGVTVQSYGYENLVGSNTVPVVPFKSFGAKLLRTPAGETVLDFGQNMAGYVQFCVDAHAGQTITLAHGEVLDENGNFTIANFQNPSKPECYQRIRYICREGRNEYRPTKCYFGFRYVKVEGDIELRTEDFSAVAISSKMEDTGFFECGVPSVNQLFHNAVWSMRSNFVDVPTDCPTREKSGYSGDLVTFVHTAMYLMDCWPVLDHWLAEQAATQFEDGCVRQVAPNGRVRGLWDGGAGWCDSMELVPWQMMRRYHNPAAVRQHYGAIRRWLLFVLERSKVTREENQDLPAELQPYFADQGMHWGEWLEPDTDVTHTQLLRHIGAHGEPEIATAFLSYGCRAISEMARALGRAEDAAFFAEAAEKARAAYRYRFVPNGRIEEPCRQCRYVRPLAMGLLNEGEKQAAADALAENISRRGNHLNTGFLSTHELCRVLTDNGHAKTAYDLLLQPEYPGWLYPISKGATTIWESWDGVAADGTVSKSMNHYSFGAVVGWLFDRVCGIVVEDGVITLRPYPDPRLGYAKARYRSPLGEITSEWHYEGERLCYCFGIPCGRQATVILPDGTRHTVGPGHHSFAC